jgi:hypothetical protein
MEQTLSVTNLDRFDADMQSRVSSPRIVEQMFARLETHLGNTPARYLALPRRDGDVEISWTTEGMQSTAMSDLDGAIAEGLVLEINEWLSELHALRVRLLHSASETDRDLAEWLKSIVTRASAEDVYLVDTRPVLANWMFPESAPQTSAVSQANVTDTTERSEPQEAVNETGQHYSALIGESTIAAVLLALASLVIFLWIVFRLIAACSFGLTTASWGVDGFDFISQCNGSSEEADALQRQIDELEAKIGAKIASCPAPERPVEPVVPPTIEEPVTEKPVEEEPVEEPVTEPEPEEVTDLGPRANLRFVSTENTNAKMCVYAVCNPYVRFTFRENICEDEPSWLPLIVEDVPEGMCQVMVLPEEISGSGGQDFNVEVELTLDDEVTNTWSFSDKMIAPKLQEALIAADNPHLYWAGDFANPWFK